MGNVFDKLHMLCGISCMQCRHEDYNPAIRNVKLVGYDNLEIATFDNVKIVRTFQERKDIFNNTIPSSNECYLMPSTELPYRLRNIYTQSIQDKTTILFCRSVSERKYIVQEQSIITKEIPNISTTYDGNMIVKCEEIIDPVLYVIIEFDEMYI